MAHSISPRQFLIAQVGHANHSVNTEREVRKWKRRKYVLSWMVHAAQVILLQKDGKWIASQVLKDIINFPGSASEKNIKLKTRVTEQLNYKSCLSRSKINFLFGILKFSLGFNIFFSQCFKTISPEFRAMSLYFSLIKMNLFYDISISNPQFIRPSTNNEWKVYSWRPVRVFVEVESNVCTRWTFLNDMNKSSHIGDDARNHFPLGIGISLSESLDYQFFARVIIQW